MVYTSITHNLFFNYPDESLFKPGLRWLGFSGIFLCFSSFIIFWIGSSIVRYLPDKISLANIASLVGIISLIVSFALLFVSYDLENNSLSYLGFISLYTGMSLTFIKDVIEYRFSGVSKILSFSGLILTLLGCICVASSFST